MKTGHRVGFGRMLWILVAVLGCSVMFGAGRASAAAPSEDELYRRALLNAMEKCYNNNEMVSSVDVGGANAYRSFGVSVLKNGKESGGIYIPTGIGTGNGLALSKTNGTQIGCYELFLGDPEDAALWTNNYDGDMIGLLDLYNVKTPESEHEAGNPIVVGAFLKRFGYTKVEALAGEGGDAAGLVCLNTSYRSKIYEEADFLPMKKFCFLSMYLDGTRTGDTIVSGVDNGEAGIKFYTETLAAGYDETGDARATIVANDSDGFSVLFSYQPEGTSIYEDTAAWIRPSRFDPVNISDLEALDGTYYTVRGEDTGGSLVDFYDFKIEVTHETAGDDAASGFTNYSMESYADALGVARESLSGGRDARQFSDFDKYTLYVSYLKKVYGATISKNPDCKSSIGSEDDVVVAVDGSTQKKYYIYAGSSGWCRIVPMTTKKEYKVSGFIPGEKYVLSTSYDFEGLVKAMYHLDTEEISANGGEFDGTSDGGSYGGDSSSGTVVTDPCYENAGSLGWVVCPLMNSLADSLGGLYDSVVEPFLVTNPELFPNVGGTHDAWNVMVGIANMLVVIFLLAVIFSQLTGVGIDNYGVKKILPKLIVVAVLVNLSYVVCQLAVDLSNILGNSLQGLLSGIDISLNSELSAVVGANGGGEAGLFRALFDIAGGGLVAIGVGSIIVSVVSSGVLAGLIIPLLLLFVTAVIAVLFFFILLGVRKAGVVILVVLSPLAFVCYMLPNAKKWFDKWLKAFQGLLLVYPICGILIGGGQLTSKIILSASNDYVMYFTGCILMVVPFFFVPTLLKGSFAAMGNIGAKISGFGKNLGTRSRNRLDSGVKNTNWYKDGTKYHQDRAALRRANRTINRLNRRSGGNANNLSRRQQARMGTAMDVFKEQRRRELENRQKSGGNYVTAMMNKQDLEVDDAAEDTLLYNDLNFVRAQQTKSQNARTERQAEADIPGGVFALNDSLARTRAQSRRDAQEIRSYADRNAGLTQANMRTELTDAIAAYRSGRSHANMLRLKAAMSSADSMGMNKDMLDSMGSLTLSANNVEDAEILNQAATSKDVVISQFGKQMSKNASANLSLDTFAGSGGTVKLSTALSEIGPNALNTANDDTLDYLGRHGRSAVNSDMLMQKALHAANDKELGKVNSMIRNISPDTIKFNGAQLASLPVSTIIELERIYRSTGNVNLENMFLNAAADISASSESLGSLHPDARAVIESIVGHL